METNDKKVSIKFNLRELEVLESALNSFELDWTAFWKEQLGFSKMKTNHERVYNFYLSQQMKDTVGVALDIRRKAYHKSQTLKARK